MIYGWKPEIGDPSWLGWITVACYLLSSLMCLRAASRDIGSADLWRALAMAMAFLGLNKQLDLQTLLTEVGRHLARTEGWYEQRRAFQKAFVVGMAVIAVLGAIVAVRLFGRRSRAFRVAAGGFVLLAAFICIRAASFHHVDNFIRATVLGARFNWIIELSGIAMIFSAATSVNRSGQRRGTGGRSAEMH